MNVSLCPALTEVSYVLTSLISSFTLPSAFTTLALSISPVTSILTFSFTDALFVTTGAVVNLAFSTMINVFVVLLPALSVATIS